jgi:hypothetical protein
VFWSSGVPKFWSSGVL